MKPILVLSIIALLMTSCTVSKRLSVFVEPEAVDLSSETIDLAAYEEKYGEYDGVFLFIENTLEHYGTKESGYNGIGASWKYVRMWRQKYIVFNPEADYLTSFRAGMPDKVYMIVTTPDGRVRRYGKEDLKKEKVTDDYDRYTLIYPDIVKGTIIEEAWENTYRGGYSALYSVDISLQFSIPCERMTFTYACPEWWSVAIKDIGPARPVAARWTYDPDTKKSILKYTADNIPAVSADEPYSPYFKEMAEYLEFHVTHLEMIGGTYDRPTSWQELAKDFKKSAIKNATSKHLSVKSTMNQILVAGSTDYDKMVKIVTYIQDNFNLDHKNMDGNCSKIIKEKRGDAFDLTVLAQAMLTEAGLETAYLLVHSAAEGYFDPKFFSMEQFHSPALRVNVDNLDYVVFPYMRHVPVDHTPRFCQGQTALMMKDGITSLWTLPEGNRAGNTMGQDYQLRIADNGVITVHEKTSASGYNGYWMRKEIEMLDEDETDDFMRDMLTFSGGDITVDSFVVHNADGANQPLEIDLYYTIANLVTVLEDEVIFQTGGLFSSLSHKDTETETSARKNPIHIDYDQQFDKLITITWPETWTLAAELVDVHLENEFGSILGEYVIGENSLTVTQRVLLNRTRADKARYPILQELIGNDTPLSIPTLVFSVETMAEPTSGATPPANQ